MWRFAQVINALVVYVSLSFSMDSAFGQAHEYVRFQHNKAAAIAQATGLDADEVRSIGAYLKRMRQAQKPPLFRIILNPWERNERNQDDRSWAIYLDAERLKKRTPTKPLKLPGMIWHRAKWMKDHLIADAHPALLNQKIARRLEHKLFEAKVFNFYVPESFPKTISLADVAPSFDDPGVFTGTLPFQQWVLKGVWDYATVGTLISDRDDLSALLDPESLLAFAKHQKSTLVERQALDPDDARELLQKHPGFRGAFLNKLLATPHLGLLQARLSFKTEYRVEALWGEVIEGATVDRQAWQESLNARGDTGVHKVQEVERVVQNFLNRLPPELRFLPYAFDVAWQPQGPARILESNAGGNSGYLVFHPDSIRAWEKFIDDRWQRGLELMRAHRLSPARQQLWLEEKASQFGLSGAQHGLGVGENCAAHLMRHVAQKK